MNLSNLYQASKEQQLALLREQTRLTGALHEAQVLQLKMWPLVAFDIAVASQFTWDPDKKVVTFTIDVLKAKPTLDWWKPRVEALNGWVQTLLGDEWCIEVKTSGKSPKSFRGSRKIVSGSASNRPVTG